MDTNDKDPLTRMIGEYEVRYSPDTAGMTACTTAPADFVFLIEFIDPCLTMTLSIDDTIFKSSPDVSLTQYVNYDPVELVWDDTAVVQSVDQCGPLEWEVYEFSTGSLVDLTLATPAQTNDLTLPTKTLSIETTDFADAQVYTLVVVVRSQNYPASELQKTFIVEVIDYCVPTSITKSAALPSPLTLEYTIGVDSELSVTFEPSPDWIQTPPECEFEYRFEQKTASADPNLFIVEDN